MIASTDLELIMHSVGKQSVRPVSDLEAWDVNEGD